MQGEIAQTIGLVLAANARLRGIAVPRWPAGPAFTFCNSVRFVGRRDRRWFGFGRSLTIADPNIWLETMPAGTQRARLMVLPRNDPNVSDRESVGFSGGGPVLFAAIVADEPEYWHGDWAVTREDEAERRIWSVTYRNLPMPPPEDSPLRYAPMCDRLAAALDDAAAFSDAHNMGFSDMLRDARTALAAADPLDGYYFAAMIPDPLMPLPYRQLFAGAARAWVFGGMGSWNDVWFEGEDQARYQAVSDALFSAIIDALTLSTNASAPGF